ncbi:MAG: DUF1501 domain-containing protein, partial [Pseudomonadota bacterium]
LVLIELAGGNDGLNTVVPIKDPAYRMLRPEIGIGAREALNLDSDTALHPSMRPLANLWEQGELQIVQGVGYPNPNRSHFRSIEIWNAGRGAESNIRDGWVSAAFDGQPMPTEHADGLVLGGSMGPLAGKGRFAAMRDEEVFVETQSNLPGGMHPVRPEGRTPLEHVLRTYDNAKVTGDLILRRLSQTDARDFEFPYSDIGQQLGTAARLLTAGVDVATLKVVQDGYDTHEAQPGEHAYLLEELSDAIGAFAGAMRQAGLWDQVTVVTFSEFGRTARENASGGTDHGTAAPVFIAGGAVNGGLSGAAPSLTERVEDDLVHTTDYRTVYHALLNDLWGINTPLFDTSDPALRIIG